MKRFAVILNVIAALVTIPAGIVTILGYVPPERLSSSLGWIATFGPSAIVVAGGISLFSGRALLASAVYVCAFLVFAARFALDASQVTRPSIAMFVGTCSSLALLVALCLVIGLLQFLSSLIADGFKAIGKKP